MTSLLGIIVLLAIAWLLSNNRRLFPWRIVLWGLGLQGILAVLLLKTPWGGTFFAGARNFVTRLLSFTDVGAGLLWGNLYRTSEEVVAFNTPSDGYWLVTNSVTGELQPLGTIFVIHILPTIIFFSSLMALLYHLGLMQKMIAVMAWVMRKTMGTSGSETLSASANVFVGQTEAPFVIKPYLSSMTRSELMAVMVGGFATVAGGVMAAYVRFGIDAGHLLAASVMSAPAALVIAKIMFPEVEESPTRGAVSLDVPREHANFLDAAAGGAAVGLKLAANVGAMLLAFTALVAMLNYGLGFLGTSLQQIFGWIFAPIAFVMGVPWSEATTFGNLLGTKIAVNEFLAYIELSGAMNDGSLSPRSVVIATYALCGFANFSSIAIQIGGIGTIAPERRADVAGLGLRAMFGGALASWLTATIAGVLIG
ncbi:NupC/NupG family nucleoside CNT transporter [bacterium DOLJORAL78_65_58]|nr:MAG: NupC/NupG family nucleoside CNT transporter [bacterium DOLJORAL78_65_58]